MKLCLTILLATGLIGCSLQPIPVHPDRLKVAQEGARPMPRGPGTKGYGEFEFTFKAREGWRMDSQTTVMGPALGLKANTGKLATYTLDPVYVESTNGRLFVTLETFKEELGPKHKGKLLYQLSPDSAHWYHHNGIKWTLAQPSVDEANSAQDVSAKIMSFHQEAGRGNLYLRIFLISPTGQEPVELNKVIVGAIMPGGD